MAQSYEELLGEIEARLPHLEPGDLPGLEGEGALVVDVRTPEEYANAHLPGAVNLPRDKLEARIADHLGRPDQPVVVYCGGRGRSTLAGWALAEMGVNVRILKGGLGAWKSWPGNP